MINRLATRPQSRNGGKRTTYEQASGGEAARRWTRSLENSIGNHPVASLAVAVSLGVFVGWLVKRR